MKMIKRLLVGLAISLLIHFLLLYTPSWFGQKVQRRSEQRIAKSKNKAVNLNIMKHSVTKPVVSRKKVAKEVVTLRLTVNDKNLQKNGGNPLLKSAVEELSKNMKPKKQVVNRDVDTKKAKLVAKKVGDEKGNKKLETVLKKMQNEKLNILQTKLTSSEYQGYLRSLKIGRCKGVATPQLIVTYYDVKEILAVHKYYGLKVIAVGSTKQRQVVELTALGADNPSYQKVENFNWQNYSNRVFVRNEPFFERYRLDIVKQHFLVASGVRLFSVVPSGVDTYFRYKQLEVIKRNGLKIDNVAAVLVRFRLVSFAGWIMVVEKIRLKDGKIIDVIDFEEKKLLQS